MKRWPLSRGKGRVMAIMGAALKVGPYPSLRLQQVGNYRLRLDPSDINDRWYYFGLVATGYVTIVERLLQPGDCVIDAGANVGHFAAVCAQRVGARGRVHAIEASPRLAQRLTSTAAEVAGGPMRVHSFALWNHSGSIPFHEATLSGWSSLVPNLTFDVAETFVVDCLSLDDFLAKNAIDHVRLLKLDLEGAETDAMLGGALAFSRGAIDAVLIEAEPYRLRAFGHTGADIASFMDEHGYQAVAYVDGNIVGPASEVSPIPGMFNGDYLYVRRELCEWATTALFGPVTPCEGSTEHASQSQAMKPEGDVAPAEQRGRSRLAHRAAFALSYAPPHVLSFLFDDAPSAAHVGWRERLDLLRQVFQNAQHPASATSFLEQLTLVHAIFRVPPHVEGTVAEFGCFKGMSSASLSLACRLTGRKLLIFDSFAGLPEPEVSVRHISGGSSLDYTKGDYAGSLGEVTDNIARFGDLASCEFVPGYFADTLRSRPGGERHILVFEDADLPESVRDVLRHGWPKLQDGCSFFTHEARDFEVVRLFFDEEFWNGEIGTHAPGIIGSGRGLNFSKDGSCLAYIVKNPTSEGKRPE